MVAEEGDTLLHYAAQAGHTVCLQLLIEAAFNYHNTHHAVLMNTGATSVSNSTNNNSTSPVSSGTRPESLSLVTGIAPVTRSRSKSQSNATPPVLVASTTPPPTNCTPNRPCVLEFVNKKGWRGYTPSHIAASLGKIDCLMLLMGCGANVDSKGDDGSTPLHLGCKHGYREVVSYLLSKGASINLQDNEQSSALHKAARYSQPQCLEELLAK